MKYRKDCISRSKEKFLAAAEIVFIADDKRTLISHLLSPEAHSFITYLLNTDSGKMAKEILKAKELKQYNGHLRSLFVLILLEAFLDSESTKENP